MQRRLLNCDPNRLRQLLEDRLPQNLEPEVVGHLDHCTACQQKLEQLAADRPWWEELPRLKDTPQAPGSSSEAGQAITSEVGARQTALEAIDNFPVDFLDPPDDPAHLGRLGPFAIVEVLGRGGMGVVFKGFDAALNRPVAIKVLAPHFASSGAARKRFQRESQAAAAVVHEHVVAIHGVDTWKGLPYLVMALVPGRSLQDRLDQEGPLQVKEILRIGMQAAAGLAAAHAQGLVHRDVKPANILLDHGVERVQLTDFGLARAVDEASLTQSGVVAGTPQYMAPEQARGETVGPRADLFSLGSTLYALAAGHPPFRAESAMAVLRRICEEPARPLRTINPEIPNWLVAIIEKLHAKDPSARFPSAASVADLLGRCLAHLEQPDTVPLPPEVPASRRRRRWSLRGCVAAVFLLLVSLGVLWWTPLQRSFYSPSGNEPLRRETATTQNSSPAITEGESIENWIQTAQQQTRALQADLQRHPIAGLADPSEEIMLGVRQKLDALELELAATSESRKQMRRP